MCYLDGHPARAELHSTKSFVLFHELVISSRVTHRPLPRQHPLAGAPVSGTGGCDAGAAAVFSADGGGGGTG